jgi:hypothetical protein
VDEAVREVGRGKELGAGTVSLIGGSSEVSLRAHVGNEKGASHHLSFLAFLESTLFGGIVEPNF